MTNTHSNARKWAGIVLLLSTLSACEATVGVNAVTVPRNAAQTCAFHCQSIGLQLAAVAIMANNVGCVCQPGAAPPAAPPTAGMLTAPAAGMATIAMQEAAAAAQRNQQQQQRQQMMRH